MEPACGALTSLRCVYVLLIDRVPDPKFIGSSLPRVEGSALALARAVATKFLDHGTVFCQEGQGGVG